MTRLILLCVSALAVAGAALAEPPAPPAGVAPPPPGAHGHMFLSPSGEPFRGPDGFAAWFDQADANHDGQLDRAEFRADAQRFFLRLDANHDGVIDGFEIGAYERDIVPELGQEVEQRFAGERPDGERSDGQTGDGPSDGRYGHHGGRRAEGGESRQDRHEHGGPRGHVALLDDPEPVAGADYNVDGHVSADEWLAAADRHFDRLDKAKAGLLTRAVLLDLLPKPGPPPKGRHRSSPG